MAADADKGLSKPYWFVEMSVLCGRRHIFGLFRGSREGRDIVLLGDEVVYSTYICGGFDGVNDWRKGWDRAGKQPHNAYIGRPGSAWLMVRRPRVNNIFLYNHGHDQEGEY